MKWLYVMELRSLTFRLVCLRILANDGIVGRCACAEVEFDDDSLYVNVNIYIKQYHYYLPVTFSMFVFVCILPNQ